ncbi:MAG: hypothetical protein ACJA1Z_003691 [Patiriisocius sp.]|jgi:hypothetical protein
MPPTSQRIKTAIQDGAESLLPEGLITSVQVTANFPEAIKDAQEAIKNAQVISEYAALSVESAMALGNTGLAVGGGAIVLMSGKNYFEAKNKAAKVCYILSMICSGTGTVSSTISVYCNKCGLSKTGMLGDGFGGLFLKAGNYMNKVGETVEGKRKRIGFDTFRPKSWTTRRPVPKMDTGYKGLSFVPTGCYPTISFQELISNIPYEKIFLVGGTVLAIYSYGKLIISVYNYLDSKFSSKENYSEQIQFSARFLVYSLFNNPVYRIYFAALNCLN